MAGAGLGLIKYASTMTPDTPESPDVAEIRALMKRYIDLFSAGETQQIAHDIYHMPFQAFLPTGPVGVTSVEAAHLALAALMGVMRVTGYAKSVMAEPAITLLHDRAAIASGAVTRYRGDGSVI